MFFLVIHGHHCSSLSCTFDAGESKRNTKISALTHKACVHAKLLFMGRSLTLLLSCKKQGKNAFSGRICVNTLCLQRDTDSHKHTHPQKISFVFVAFLNRSTARTTAQQHRPKRKLGMCVDTV